MAQTVSNHMFEPFFLQCLDEWETVLKLLKSTRTSPPPESEGDQASFDTEHRPDLTFPGSLPSEEPDTEDSGLPKEESPPKQEEPSPDQNEEGEGVGELDNSEDLFS